MQLTKAAGTDAMDEDFREINYAINLAVQKQHCCKQQYFINRSLHEEINLINAVLMPSSGVSLVTPISHMILRTQSFSACGDACLSGGGGFSLDMKF